MHSTTMKSLTYGTCEVELYCDPGSAVDSYIVKAYSEQLERDLNDYELDKLTNECQDQVMEYSYGQGGSRNHN